MNRHEFEAQEITARYFYRGRWGQVVGLVWWYEIELSKSRNPSQDRLGFMTQFVMDSYDVASRNKLSARDCGELRS